MLKLYQFQDSNDCALCHPAFCFYYDGSFHYTAVSYGFYEDEDDFLRDSIYYTNLRDSIVAVEIPQGELNIDTIKCAFEYESHLRFSFAMIVTKKGTCELSLLSPYQKEGLYRFDLTSSEKDLVAYSLKHLLADDTGNYTSYNNCQYFVDGEPLFCIQLSNGHDKFLYRGGFDADSVPDGIYLMADAFGAIAQNHFSKMRPLLDTTRYLELYNKIMGMILPEN